AGVVDIGDGWAVAFKIESHNHPSAIEPFQGAATGVGGIVRDIFTMGARPICALNSLRFGPITGDTANGTQNTEHGASLREATLPGAGNADLMPGNGDVSPAIANNRRLFAGVV